MSGNKLLLDTNILIYLSKKEIALESFAKSDDLIGISVITYMEALGFPFQNKPEEEIIVALCDNLKVFQLSDEIISLVISLRKEGKIKLPDAIILATAMVNNLQFITHNVSDFIPFSNRIIIRDPLEK